MTIWDGKTMRTGIYLGREQVEIRRAPVPEPGPNDVLIQNIYSSICGTDVAVYQHGPSTGHKVQVGGEFGHETVSVVVAVGTEVRDFHAGQRVYPYPLYVTGETSRAGTIGAFSEYILARNARLGHSLYAVPNEIPSRVACLTEPFTVGGRAAKQAGPLPGETAVVFGCGTIGIGAALMLQWLGVERVMVCDVSDFRLGIARELGFATCNTGEVPLAEAAEPFFGRAYSLAGPVADIDIWIDAAGATSIFEQFMAYGKIGARYVTVAVSNAVRPVDFLQLTYASKAVIGSGGYRPDDVPDAFGIMASGRWDIERIITHEFELAELERAIQIAGDASRALNVVIRFDEGE